MIKKFKTLLGVTAAVATTAVFNPQDVKAKTHNMEISEESFDDAAEESLSSIIAKELEREDDSPQG